MLTTLATCAFLLGPLSCLAAPASNSSTYPSTTGNSTNLWPPGGNTPFPSQAQITTIFNYLVDGQSEHFLAHILPTVNWTIEGTHPLAGEYHNATYFTENALARLDNLASPQDPLEVALVNVIGGGNQDWSASELHIFGTVKNGELRWLRYRSCSLSAV